MRHRPWLKRYSEYLEAKIEYPNKTLAQILQDQAQKRADNVLLIFEDRRMSYREVDDLSTRFAATIKKLGYSKGVRIALSLPNIPQFVISLYGALKAGAIVVPCNPMYREKELEYQLKDSGSEVLVACCDKLGEEEPFKDQMIAADRAEVKHIFTTSILDLLSQEAKSRRIYHHIHKLSYPKTLDLIQTLSQEIWSSSREDLSSEDLAVIQYTGGTTGISKGAMLTHRNLVSNAVAMAHWLHIGEEDIGLGALPFFHIYGLTVALNTAIVTGSSIVLIPRFDAETVLEAIERNRITRFCGVPAMFNAVISHPRVGEYDLSSLKICVSGGASLPRALAIRFKETVKSLLVEGYGLSEASPVTHCNPVGREEDIKTGSIGLPIFDTDAKIVDLETGEKELKTDEAGELVVRGPQVMKGYWRNIDETRIALREGWLYTGDIAKMDSEGYFYIVDRKKDMINVSGYKVWPREVEEVIFENQAVKEAAVIGIPDRSGGEVVKAYIVLKEGYQSRPSEDELISFCKRRIAPYKVPRVIEFCDRLPKSGVGKILKRELKKRELEDL